MFFRVLFVGLILITMAACSSKDKAPIFENMDNVDVSGQFDQSDSEGILSNELKDITPGSQEELVSVIGDRVFFSFNSAVLSENAQKTLQRQSKWLLDNPRVKITIEGHCDERGTREFNLALGERRATAVRNYLVSLGTDASRVSTISYGKEHPEYLGSNEVAWSKNRRAVTVATN